LDEIIGRSCEYRQDVEVVLGSSFILWSLLSLHLMKLRWSMLLPSLYLIAHLTVPVMSVL
jgi:hypothetical protein